MYSTKNVSQKSVFIVFTTMLVLGFVSRDPYFYECDLRLCSQKPQLLRLLLST